LNRLVHAHASRVACAAALWLTATADLSAQIQMPAGVAPAPPSAVPNGSDAASLASGQKWLAEARAALSKADFHTAVQSFRKAAGIAQTVPQLSTDVEKLRGQLQQIGIDNALLTVPAAPVADANRLPSVNGASPLPSANPANRKQEALRLVAIGRSALDRGDIPTALAAARQAESLKVPETEFAAGEPRVWQLLLDAESAARRTGIALTAGNNAGPNGSIQTAGGTDAGNNRVAQMLFNAESDASGNVQQVQNTQFLPGTDSNYAEQMLNEGLQALGAGNSALAR
jgi:general secretion pathway protein D